MELRLRDDCVGELPQAVLQVAAGRGILPEALERALLRAGLEQQGHEEPAGGRGTCVPVAPGDGGRVEVETFAEKNEVGIAVSDSGPGVAEDEREKIFEVFYTTKRGGTGLGLNIAKRIAEEHGGGIALEESSLGGARFVVRLPMSNKG